MPTSFPEEWINLLEREGKANGAVVTVNDHGLRMVDGPKLPFRQTFPHDMTDVPTILQNMDKARIDLRILSLTNPMVYWAPDSFSMKLSQSFNDALSAACQAHPDKLRGAIMLPMQAPATGHGGAGTCRAPARHVLRLYGPARQRRESRRPFFLADL